MYTPIVRTEIADRLMHLRDLFRAVRPLDARGLRAHEKRETITKNLLSNLVRTKDHPTLRTVMDVAEIFSLTMDGAHRLFGYDIDQIREYDLRLNGGRTHVVESYPFSRDLMVDLPSRLVVDDPFGTPTSLRDLVPEWQEHLPIRSLEGDGWRRRGAFYVHIGTEDSLGTSLPPGALALVEPISENEERRPNPRAIYLLQFANGYRCSQCVVTGNKLLLLVSGRDYAGPQEFRYPGAVRIAGRVRMFALALPSPEYPHLKSLPSSPYGAPLILPWEHASRDLPFSAKQQRFHRTQQERIQVQEVLHSVFASELTARTERRYRSPTASQPHVDTLIQMAVTHLTRYTDSLRVSRALPSDRGRLSLETLLNARTLADVEKTHRRAHVPVPTAAWQELRADFLEWPASLSMRFPRAQTIKDRVLRLPQGANLHGIAPAIAAGSMLLLEDTPSSPQVDAGGSGWGRAIYVLNRGAEVVCGYLRVAEKQFVLSHDPRGSDRDVLIGADEMPRLSRVVGVAVPV